jgi:hypothetical protein
MLAGFARAAIFLAFATAAGECTLMSTAGFLRIDLRVGRRDGCVRSATIELKRPDVTRLLIGRAPQDAVELVASFHAVCGAAHRLAAQRAVAAARYGFGERLDATLEPHGGATADCGDPAAVQALRPAELAVLHEITIEHLLRLFIDWPAAVGQPVQPSIVRDWRLRLKQTDPAIGATDVDAVLRHGASVVAAVPSTGGIGVRLRRRVRKTAACLMAVKLATRCPGKIRQWVSPPAAASVALRGGDGHRQEEGIWGEGRAMTARGELIHRLRLGRDACGREVVAGWRIDTPTDRLFVNGGPVTQALQQMHADGLAELQRLATLSVLSFDPCFECRIKLSEVRQDDA